MTVREALHDLVDQLGDERAEEALAYLRGLLDAPASKEGRAMAHLRRRMQPLTVPGGDFFTQPAADLETLAARQGVKPVTRFDDLLGDFWPEDETADEFIAAVRQWRLDDGNA